MFAYVIKPFNPTLNSWDDVVKRPDLVQPAFAYLRSNASRWDFARWQISAIAERLDLDLAPDQLDERTRDYAQLFAVGITLFNQILAKILIQGCNLTKRNKANWFWDLQLALSIGADHEISGKSMLLVTSDNDVLQAAKEAGHGDFVINLRAYRARLGLAES
jgi:hypothetical protein